MMNTLEEDTLKMYYEYHMEQMVHIVHASLPLPLIEANACMEDGDGVMDEVGNTMIVGLCKVVVKKLSVLKVNLMVMLTVGMSNVMVGMFRLCAFSYKSSCKLLCMSLCEINKYALHSEL